MKALHRMDRYRKEVLQLSTRKHGINVQYLYDMYVQVQIICFQIFKDKFVSTARLVTLPQFADIW